MSLAAILEQTNVYTVSELNTEIRNILESQYRYIWLRGEISDFKQASSGHCYFALKDEKCSLPVVLFKGQQRHLEFQPENGLQVLCQGRVTVYEARGRYQFIVERMEPHGIGALQLAFEQLKEKLLKEGLFAEERKKPLPRKPQRIAVITSPTGAAIQDILKVLRRSPFPLQITILPTRVQGEGAAGEIASAITTAGELTSQHRWELLIVGRGGGSIEDLWCFNDELVARALAACPIPTISAVGHEIDLTISDLVADLRAPTPTGAAEWVVLRLEEIHRALQGHGNRLLGLLQAALSTAKQKVTYLEKRLVDPRRRLEDWRIHVDERQERLLRAMRVQMQSVRARCAHSGEKLFLQNPRGRLKLHTAELARLRRDLLRHLRQDIKSGENRLQHLSAQLQSLSPLAILARGYSITFKQPDQIVVRDHRQVHPGDLVRIQLAEGLLECTVEETRTGSLSARNGKE